VAGEPADGSGRPRTVLDVGHKVQWGLGVSAYLVTKGLAAGAAMLAPFAGHFGLHVGWQRMLPELIALVFTAITTFLLVEDLKRPMKFLTLLRVRTRRAGSSRARGS
jgi:formate-dependent nitrite reductase membrane component NrfD